MEKQAIKIAVLDMYSNTANEGMRCIGDLIKEAAKRHRANTEITYNIFDVRFKTEIPDINDYDIFVSSGGPGDPYEGEGTEWEKNYFNLLDLIWSHNQNSARSKKYIFLICHSFQLMARHFGLAEIRKRWRKSFGIWRFLKTEAGHDDPILRKLYNPFYAADSRQYEVVQPNSEVLEKLGAKIIAKELKHEEGYESALMAVRLSPEIVGTQFHPETDPDSMALQFRQDDKKKFIMDTFGEQAYFQMLANIDNPISIRLTRNSVMPIFFDDAIKNLLNKRQ